MPMFRNEYPDTNLHEINLDWIIKNVEDIRALVDKYIINYEQITFADPIGWEYAVAYPMHTIVLDQSYNAYMSKQDVPSYTQLGDTDYWLKIGDFFKYIEKALSNLAYNESTRKTASKSYAAGELLVNNDVLYRAMVQMPAGTTFVIGANIEQVTMESLLNDLKTDLSANSAAIQTNANNIAANTTAIQTNATNIAANTTAIQTNAANIAAIRLHEIFYDVTTEENSVVSPYTAFAWFDIPTADLQTYGIPIVSHTLLYGAPLGASYVEPGGKMGVCTYGAKTIKVGVIFLKTGYVE